MKIFRRLENELGVTLVEVMVAGVLFLFISLAFIHSITTGQAMINSEGERRIAATLAQQKLEELRSEALQSKENFYAISGATNPYSDEDPVTGYPNHRRTVTTNFVDATIADGDPVDYTDTAGGGCAPPNCSFLVLVTVSEATAGVVNFGNVVMQMVITKP